MKKALKIIAVVLVMAAVVGTAVLCVTSGYFSDIQWNELTAEEIEAYLNEEVIPMAVVVITAIGTVMMSIIPVMNGVKKASEKFRSAEEGIKITSSESKRTNEETKQIFDQIKDQTQQMRDTCKRTDEKIERLEAMEKRIERMMIIGFCNNPDLVRGGFAKMIYNISDEGENASKNAQRTEVEEIPAPAVQKTTEGENEREKEERADDKEA